MKLIKKIIAYNCSAEDFSKGFPYLYEVKRRDAMFAGVFQVDDRIIAFRDHLGTVPVYYRKTNRGYKFALSINDLVRPDDHLSTLGVKTFLVFGTTKLAPIISEVKIVPPGCVVEFNLKTGRRKVEYQYYFKPNVPVSRKVPSLAKAFEKLFLRALKRQVKSNHVSLYLSGGVDSALIAWYLGSMGVVVDAYTVAPWGINSQEVELANLNAKLTKTRRHEVLDFESNKYKAALVAMPNVYRGLHASSTALAISGLWLKTDIDRSAQIFLGQNSDTLFGTVNSQSDSFFLSLLPLKVRKKISKNSHHRLLEDCFIGYLAKGIIGQPKYLTKIMRPYHYLNRVQRLILIGMLVGLTPRDGEALTQPAIARDIMIGNPYYDVDVIEFGLGIPTWLRIKNSFRNRTFWYFDKTVLRYLATKYFPDEVVFRKKAFTVPFDKDQKTKRLYESMPSSLLGISLPDVDSRLAANQLVNWSHGHKIKLSMSNKFGKGYETLLPS